MNSTKISSPQAARGTSAAYDRAFQTLFVIGCPRSGTTWTQLLLSQVPIVATAPETQIFAYYLDHFRRQWRHEHEGPGRALQGQAGLSRLLSEEEFQELCRRSAGMVLDKIAAKNPEASLICEKSPQHALQADFIQKIFPDAYFLHVIRDPRDTAASLMAAARSWGFGWAPRNAIDAARMWNDHVLSARRVSQTGDRYLEVQYEAMQRDTIGEMGRILTWLDIPQERDVCEEAVRACELAKLRKGMNGQMPIPSQRSPKGFFRKGTVGGWQEDLTRTEIRIVEHLCSGVMQELGYTPVTSTKRPIRVPLHDGIQRVRESIDWQLERLLHRV